MFHLLWVLLWVGSGSRRIYDLSLYLDVKWIGCQIMKRHLHCLDVQLVANPARFLHFYQLVKLIWVKNKKEKRSSETTDMFWWWINGWNWCMGEFRRDGKWPGCCDDRRLENLPSESNELIRQTRLTRQGSIHDTTWTIRYTLQVIIVIELVECVCMENDF